MGEIRRIGEIAEGREPMLRLGRIGRCGEEGKEQERG